MKHSNQTKKSPLAFFGAADFSVPTLETLIQAGHDVAVVVTKPDTARGRGMSLHAPEVKKVAKSHGIPVVQPAGKNDILPLLKKYRLEAAVVVAYGLILPQAVLDRFPLGMVNVHASLLPKWRGPSPIEAAILAGDKLTGISIMKLENRMDAGPIYGFSQIPLPDDMTRPAAYEVLSRLGSETLAALLPDILNGNLDPIPQSEDDATYCNLIKKPDGAIDWSLPAAIIERQIRAYLGWPGSYGELAGLSVTLTGAEVISGQGQPGKHFVTENKELAIYCGQSALLIKTLKPAGKREVSGADFVRGYIKD